jgi:hypothetical protein
MSYLKSGEKEFVVPVEFFIVAKSKEAAYKKVRDWFDARYDGKHNPKDCVESAVTLANVKERCPTCLNTLPCPVCKPLS